MVPNTHSLFAERFQPFQCHKLDYMIKGVFRTTKNQCFVNFASLCAPLRSATIQVERDSPPPPSPTSPSGPNSTLEVVLIVAELGKIHEGTRLYGTHRLRCDSTRSVCARSCCKSIAVILRTIARSKIPPILLLLLYRVLITAVCPIAPLGGRV